MTRALTASSLPASVRAKLSAQSLKVRRDKETERMRRRFFIELCREHGIPAPKQDYRFAAPDRQWQLDLAWVDARVAIEVQGGIFVKGAHSRGKHQLEDFAKMNAAQLRQWRVLQVTPTQLCTAETIDMVKLALQPIPMGNP